MMMLSKIIFGEQTNVSEIVRVSVTEAQARFQILLSKSFSSLAEQNTFLCSRPELNNLMIENPQNSLGLGGRQIYNKMPGPSRVETRIIQDCFIFIIRNAQKTRVSMILPDKKGATQLEITEQYTKDFYLNIHVNLLIEDLKKKLRENAFESEEALSGYLSKRPLLHTLDYAPVNKRYTEFAGTIMQHHAQSIERVITCFFENQLLIFTYGFNQFKQAPDIWLGVLKIDKSEYRDIGVTSFLDYGAGALVGRELLDMNDETTSVTIQEMIRYDRAYALFNKIRRENGALLKDYADKATEQKLNDFLLIRYPELIGLRFFSPTDKAIQFILWAVQHQFTGGAFVEIRAIDKRCILVISNKTKTKHLAAYLTTKNKGKISWAAIPNTEEKSIKTALDKISIPRTYISLKLSGINEMKSGVKMRVPSSFKKTVAWLNLHGLTTLLSLSEQQELLRLTVQKPSARPHLKNNSSSLTRSQVELVDPLTRSEESFQALVRGLKQTYNAPFLRRGEQYRRYALEEFCMPQTLLEIKKHQDLLLEHAEDPEYFKRFFDFMAKLRLNWLHLRYQVIGQVLNDSYERIAETIIAKASVIQQRKTLQALLALNASFLEHKVQRIDWVVKQANIYFQLLEKVDYSLYSEIIDIAEERLVELKEKTQL